MAVFGQDWETPWNLWRCLANPITMCLAAFRQQYARRREVEVFPWLEHVAAGAAILGASFGIGTGWVCRLGTNGLIYGGLLGATSGALIAIGLVLSWGVETPSPVASPVPGSVDLWDSWLDEGESNVEETEASGVNPQPPLPCDECAAELRNERVFVRPRALSFEGSESVPLEAEIGPLLAQHDRGTIGISGPPGSGKSMALLHLAGRIPAHFQVSFLDQPHPLAFADAAERGPVVCTLSGPFRPKLLAEFALAPWGKDEWIEYLLGASPSRCGSVMARLAEREVEQGLLQGIPELWQVVLDRMAADETIQGPRQALWIELDRHLDDRRLRQRIEADCLAALVVPRPSSNQVEVDLGRHTTSDTLHRLIRHRSIQLLLAADWLADDLTRGVACEALTSQLPRALIDETAWRLAGRPESVQSLKHLIAAPDESRHAMVASLLHALRVDWKPDRPPPCLRGAYLAETVWTGINLASADLRHAELNRARMCDAVLDRTQFDHAQLADADLHAASLDAARLDGADLSRARLAKVRAQAARFESACLHAADLEASHLDQVRFVKADLSGARLVAASLVGARLTYARLDETDFNGANLSGAILSGLTLSRSQFENARFTGAKLLRSHLEGMSLPHANFAEADLSHALLTGTFMVDADFRGARLCEAGLAEVHWERADLRNADLRGAAFHLGSSRSGLVASTTPCEGSRTGFYTDEYNEQDYKSPEEIRKANLCGADLRGAQIDGVDFYLVDLRGARVDQEQIAHLRRCGAILQSRV